MIANAKNSAKDQSSMSGVVWSVDHKVLFEQVGLHISDNAKVSLDALLAIAQMHPPPLALRALLDHDLNAFGRGFAAFASMNSATSTTLTGPYFVQIDAVDDASTPKRRVQGDAADDVTDDASSNRRCLKFRLSDGAHKFDALEFASLAEIVDFDRTPPGTKLVLRNVRVVRGWALLTPECVQVIGGSVEALVKVFEFNRTMARRERSLARPVAARDPGDPGPPQFTLPTDLRTAPITAAQSSTSTSTTSTSMSTADVDTRLPPGLDIPATPAAAAAAATTSQARPSAKQKGKFAPMPVVNRNASTPAATPAESSGKFAPMPANTNRSNSVNSAAPAPKQKGKFAPMPTKRTDVKQPDKNL